MKISALCLFCGMLLTISAIADDKTQDAWLNNLDHNSDGSVSLDELQTIRSGKFYLLDINHNNVTSPIEVVGSTSWVHRIFSLDNNAGGLVNLAEFETMGATAFTVLDINAVNQITAHEAFKINTKL